MQEAELFPIPQEPLVEPLDAHTYRQLRTTAKLRKLPGYASLNKQELLQALES
jgi:hypothetical protein